MAKKKKKLKKLKIRIPVPPPNQAHKSVKDYKRIKKVDLRDIDKE